MKRKTTVCWSGRSFSLIVGIVITGAALAGCGKTEGPGGPPQWGIPEVAVAAVKPEPVTLSDELPGGCPPFWSPK